MQQTSYNPNIVGYPQSYILGPSDMDAIQPDVADTLYNKHGDEYMSDFRLWLKMHGMMQPTNNPNGGRLFEAERVDRVITVKTNVATAGTTLSFQIDNNEIESLGGSPYVYPQVYDTIWDPKTTNIGQVQSVDFITSPGNCIITAISETGTAWNVPVANDEFAVMGNANPENSAGPDVRASYWTGKAYKLQIQRQAVAVTDLAAGAKLFPVNDQFGNNVQFWTSSALVQLEKRHLKYIYSTIWLGKNTTQPGLNTTTSGIFNEFYTQGAQTVNVAGDDYLTAFNTLNNAILENSPFVMNYVGYLNRNLVQPINDDLRTYYPNSNIKGVDGVTAEYMFGENATKGMAVRFDFQEVVVNGFTYNLLVNKPSYDPNVMGITPATNFFAQTAYFFPSRDTTDPQGQLTRNMMLRYYSIPIIPQVGRLKIYYLEQGGLAKVPTDRQLRVINDAVSYFGLQTYNLPQCGMFYKPVGS